MTTERFSFVGYNIMEQRPYSNGGLECLCIAVSSGDESRAV